MDNQLPEVPVVSVKKNNHLLLPIILVAILVGLYALYSHFFLLFKTIATLSYDSQKAVTLLREPDTFAYTKGGKLFIGNTSAEELLLAPADVTKNITSLKLSKNRRYIAWQSDNNINVLQVSQRKVFVVYPNTPKQIFDISPIKNSILFLTKNQLLEVNLENGYIQNRVSLSNFDNVSYSPSGQVAQVGKFAPQIQDRKKIVVNLQTHIVTLVSNDFYKTCTLEPTWKDNNTFYVSRNNQLETYDIYNNVSTSLIAEKSSGGIGPYNVNPTGETIAYTVAKDKITIGAQKQELYTNTEIDLADVATKQQKTLIKSYDPRLGYKQLGNITNVGWLNDDTLWFTVNTQFSVRDVWVINKDGSGLKKVIEQAEQYSL